MEATSPTLGRRRLQRALRALREQAGLSTARAAELLEWSDTTIWRIETGRTKRLRTTDVAAMCRAYGADEEVTTSLLELARGARQRGWWQRHGAALATWFEDYVGLETEASRISTYESEAIPGLLQTEAYAREVSRVRLMDGTPDDVEQLVQVRLGRQEILDRADPPRLWAIVSEAVLRRVVGNRGLMRLQLEHLIEAAQRPHVTVQVLPFEAGAHASMSRSFIQLGFPEAVYSDIVYLEYERGALYLEEEAEIERYTMLLDHLRARALDGDRSLEWIDQASKALAIRRE